MNYEKGTKVIHVRTGSNESIIGLCKIKYEGVWVDGVIYEGLDRFTNTPMTFVRRKDEFEKEFNEL